MKNQTIPNQYIFVRKDREDSFMHFGVPYRTEMQTSKLDEVTPERQTTREKSQSMEMDGLVSKYLERQALREQSQDRYDGQRSGKCDCDEKLKMQNFYRVLSRASHPPHR